MSVGVAAGAAVLVLEAGAAVLCASLAVACGGGVVLREPVLSMALLLAIVAIAVAYPFLLVLLVPTRLDRSLPVVGAATVRFSLHRDPRWRGRFPACETPGRPSRPSFVTTGLPIADDGRNEAMDLTEAARNALRRATDGLSGSATGFARASLGGRGSRLLSVWERG